MAWYFFRFSISRHHVGSSDNNVGNDPFVFKICGVIMRLDLPAKYAGKRQSLMETPTGALVTAPAVKRSTGKQLYCLHQKKNTLAYINGKSKAAIVFRYKLRVSTEDIKPNEENKEFIGGFMFF
jgi:hypothetical protein